MAGITDFIQNYLAIAQFREGVRQNRVQEGTSRANQLMGFVNLARQTRNPAELEALTSTFEKLGVADRGTLTQLLTGTAPTAEVVQAGALQQGMQSIQGTPLEGTLNRETAFQMLTGKGWGDTMQSNFLGQLFEGGGAQLSDAEKGLLSQGLLTRTATGMDPGAFAMSRTLAGLPQEQLTHGAEIGIGTRMNAAQSASNDLNNRQFLESTRQFQQNLAMDQGRLALGWAGHRLNNRQFEFNSALATQQLGVEAQQAGQFGVPGANAVSDLLQTQRNLMDTLTRDAATMSPEQIRMYLRSIDTSGAALQRAGYDAVRIPNPDDHTQVFQPGFWSHQQKAFGRGR